MTTSHANTSVAIRLATAADRSFLDALAQRLADFSLPAGRTREEIVEGDRRALHDALDDPHSGTELFIAELDGRRAGCLLMWTLDDYFSKHSSAHVSVLAVAREAEGRGVGTALMLHAEAWARARGHARMTLNVFEGNNRARRLYERAGLTSEMRRYAKTL